jgi:hypothetical protein
VAGVRGPSRAGSAAWGAAALRCQLSEREKGRCLGSAVQATAMVHSVCDVVSVEGVCVCVCVHVRV